MTSLAVLIGAIGVWLGYPIIDPLIGLLIIVAILKIVIDTSKPVFIRLLDGVEPETIDKVKVLLKASMGFAKSRISEFAG